MLLLEIAFSPWDRVQTCDQLAPGVYWVTTAGHGGLMVDASTATETLSLAARKHGMKWNRFYCYEEDCQCSIAFYERPEWFKTWRQREPTEKEKQSVLDSVKNWEWRYYEAKTGTTLQPGESYCKDSDQRRQAEALHEPTAPEPEAARVLYPIAMA